MSHPGRAASGWGDFVRDQWVGGEGIGREGLARAALGGSLGVGVGLVYGMGEWHALVPDAVDGDWR